MNKSTFSGHVTQKVCRFAFVFRVYLFGHATHVVFETALVAPEYLLAPHLVQTEN